MSELSLMGHFTAWPMRGAIPQGGIAIDTCARNDTAERGTDLEWVWCNPTNRAIRHTHAGATAVSVEALWQGLKVIPPRTGPDVTTLVGDWRRGKKARPIGHWNGEREPLITTPGDARRAIYVPAFRRLVEHWLTDPIVADRVVRARRSPAPIFLRDWDTGRGIDRNGPMSHAWVLAVWLNTGSWPDRDAAPEAVRQRPMFPT